MCVVPQLGISGLPILEVVANMAFLPCARDNINGVSRLDRQGTKNVSCRFRHGFCEGTTPKPMRAAVAVSSWSSGFQSVIK